MIHVVAIGRLARTSMPAPIMRDDAIAMVQEKHHLRVPVIRSERPAVRKHNRLSFTPVLVENLCTVLRRDRAHVLSSFSGMGNGCSVGLFGRCERCDGHAASGSETDAGDQERPAGPIDVVCLCFAHGSLRHCAARPVFVLTDVVWRARVSGMYPRSGCTIRMTRTDARAGSCVPRRCRVSKQPLYRLGLRVAAECVS